MKGFFFTMAMVAMALFSSAAVASEESVMNYKVQKGDNVSSRICKRAYRPLGGEIKCGTDFTRAVAKLNGRSERSLNRIYPGEMLQIPRPKSLSNALAAEMAEGAAQHAATLQGRVSKLEGNLWIIDDMRDRLDRAEDRLRACEAKKAGTVVPPMSPPPAPKQKPSGEVKPGPSAFAETPSDSLPVSFRHPVFLLLIWVLVAILAALSWIIFRRGTKKFDPFDDPGEGNYSEAILERDAPRISLGEQAQDSALPSPGGQSIREEEVKRAIGALRERLHGGHTPTNYTVEGEETAEGAMKRLFPFGQIIFQIPEEFGGESIPLRVVCLEKTREGLGREKWRVFVRVPLCEHPEARKMAFGSLRGHLKKCPGFQRAAQVPEDLRTQDPGPLGNEEEASTRH